METSGVTIESLLQRVAELEQTVATLQEENKLLREQLEQQQRTNARQAAPFRRRNKKIPEDQKNDPVEKKDTSVRTVPFPNTSTKKSKHHWIVVPNAALP